MNKVYLDHSATTPVDKEVAKLVFEYMVKKYGNASSIHYFGREAHMAMEDAREKIANLIGAQNSEIFFTSGGTEADNLAIKGIAYANRKKGNHIITTTIEHKGVLYCCKYLEKQGFKVTYLPVDEYAMIRLDELKNAITDQTILISIMFANNEVGTIQPIKEIGKIAKKMEIYFHTDAVQAVGNYPVNVNECNIDLLSISGHKFNGPKGVGVLYVRKGVNIESLQHGGGQERCMRSGTENITGIVGIGKAAEIAKTIMEQKIKHIIKLRNYLIEGIIKKIPFVKLNGHLTKRLPGNVNFSFLYVEGEAILLNLDLKGIAASSGSACTSGSLDPSHVLLAMGLSHEIAHGSLRLSIGQSNTQFEINYVLNVLPEIIERLRNISPLYC